MTVPIKENNPMKAKYRIIADLILYGLRHDNFIPSKVTSKVHSQRIHEMHNLYHLISPVAGGWTLNLDIVQRCCYVVPDDLYELMQDPQEYRILKAKAKGLDDKEAKKRAKKSEQVLNWRKEHRYTAERLKKRPTLEQLKEEAKDEWGLDKVLLPGSLRLTREQEK